MPEQDTIEVDLDTDERPFPDNVEEGAYVHTSVDGLRVLVPARAFTLPEEARQNFERGTPQLLSTLPSEVRRKILAGLKGPEETRRERNKPYEKWTY